MEWTNLYLQTEYSMLSSALPLNQAVKLAKRMGMKALGIADNAMHGVIKFYKACLEHGIKPIIGLQVELDSLNDQKSVILLYAKSNLGYQNLMQIATVKAVNDGISLDELQKYHQDIIAIIASDEHSIVRCIKDRMDNIATDLIKKYQEVFIDLYIGLDMQTTSNREHFHDLVRFAAINHVPCVAIHKTSYETNDDLIVYDTLKAIANGGIPYQHSEKEANSRFIDQNEINNLFKNYQELINNTEKISEMIYVNIEFGKYHLPKYDIENADKYLVELCKVGLNKRLAGRNVNVNKYKDRLLYELDTIRKMGFSDYFLIVYDYVKYAKQSDILVGPGRGSAPGSLVSYVLGITDIDPIQYNLLFERFLNSERISMPDIDVDFPDDRRDEVINYLGSKYGQLKVANITTFDTFGAKSAIRDIARVMKMTDDKLNYILKAFPVSQGNLEVIINANKHLQELINRDEDLRHLFYIARKIEGMPRHTSTHAAGIIMADRELLNYTPLQKGINNLLQTQYEASDLEELGLVKMDILGIRNLTLIKNVLNDIKKEKGLTINLYKIPIDDKATYAMIRKGDTDGIFQLESQGMRNLLINLKTANFMDIVNANALYRPGPMEIIPIFIARKFGEKVEYIHRDLQDILQETYGTIVFQEQIMLIAQKFAGYSLGMADILRRAVSKKNVDTIEKERIRFIAGAVKKGYSQELGNEIYDYIEKFANYGFNKSHSVAYSMIAYWMAYLKVNYYTFFMANLMTNSTGSSRLLQRYVMDCRKNKVEVHPPHINISHDKFVVRDIGIYYSLLGIANIGNVVVSKILEEREAGVFKSYEDFINRCGDFVNKKVVTNLIHAGALSCFGLTYREMIETYDSIREKKAFKSVLGDKIIKSKLEYQEYTFDEISFMEKEALGFNLKYSLFIKYADVKAKYRTVDLVSLKPGNVAIIFIIRNIKQILTKKGEQMAFLEIYDETASADAVIFPNVYNNYKEILAVGATYIAKGKVEERNGKNQIIFETVYTVKENY